MLSAGIKPAGEQPMVWAVLTMLSRRIMRLWLRSNRRTTVGIPVRWSNATPNRFA
jgi:hypothetical protein